MPRSTAFLISAALSLLALTQTAGAENSAVLRDCALGPPAPPAVDPDFVLLSGGTLAIRNGMLSVLPSQRTLVLTASELVDRGDGAGGVHLMATVQARGMLPQNFMTQGVGFVFLELPLNNLRLGQVYAISWAATFDNGQHACPGMLTLSNQTPIPFVVGVVPR